MNRRRNARTPVSRLAALAGLILLGACAVRTSHGPARGVAQATVDTVAAHLADLEARRVAAAAGMADTPERRALDDRIAALWEQLRELPDRAPAERAVTRHVLDARQAGLAVQRRQLLVSYTAESPLVRRAVAEERALERRRAELRAALREARGANVSRR